MIDTASPTALPAHLAAALSGLDADAFAALVPAAFAFQRNHVAPFAALCARRGLASAVVDDWQDVPLVPALAFKTMTLAAAPAALVFRSSGTSASGDPQGRRSEHHHPFPDLYRAVIEASFPTFCLETPHERPPMLALVPPLEVRADSSLSFMVDHLMRRFADPERSVWGMGPRGIELTRVRSWLGARQRAGSPVLLVTTSLALAQLLDGLDRLGLRFRLPPGSRYVETGGAKTREHELDLAALAERAADNLGLTRQRRIGEYGMTELTSQLYTASLAGGDPDLYVAPPWVRLRILDAASLEPLPPGSDGLVAIFDLANVGSALHLLTEDLGRLEPGGLRLLGRAHGAELRGCSQVAEELARARG